MDKMDKLVIDIETKNTFADVGRDNFEGLEISLVGIYSYERDRFFSFGENEIEKVGELLKSAGLLIGFSINNFDLPVLKKYFPAEDGFNIFSIPRIDIFDEIELLLGRRIGLDVLAKANLGFGKNGHGLEAAGLYRDGKIEELKNYCLNDVKITRDLYELAKSRGYLLIPQKSGGLIKLNFNFAHYF